MQIEVGVCGTSCDHGTDGRTSPVSCFVPGRRGFGLSAFLGALHAYSLLVARTRRARRRGPGTGEPRRVFVAERRGQRVPIILRVSPQRRKQTSITGKALEHDRVGRLLRSSLSCGFSVGRHPRPFPGPAALRAELAASSAPSCPNCLTRCITHSPHASQGASLTPRTSCYGERSSQHKRMVLAGWRGSGLPLIASWPRAPRPVCQRSDEVCI
jgi:hypothetical protein